MNEAIFDYIKNFPNPRKWEKIIVHHSQSGDNIARDWDGIREYHRSLGYDDIGYHFGLEFVNGKFQYQIGRPLDKWGAHCYGQNDKSIGICLVGNYDLTPPSHQKYFLLACLCRANMLQYSIEIKDVQPHWVYSNIKTCPGKQFSILKLREYIEGVKVA